VRNIYTGIKTKAEIEERQNEEDTQVVYTLGMEDRSTKNRNVNPGPGQHEIEGTVSHLTTSLARIKRA